jgi:AcrR family transcriptional regulator
MNALKLAKSSKRQLLRQAATNNIASYLLSEGLADTRLRRLAAECQISNRMLLYYFEDKNDILTTVLTQLADEFADRLAELAPDDCEMSPLELLKVSAVFSRNAEMQPYFRVFIEVIAASAKGVPPYPAIAESMFDGFLEWTSQRLAITNPDERRATAIALIAIIDGLAVVAIGMGQAAATDAITILSKVKFSDGNWL